MTVQARALGLYVRQFRAFDRAGLAAQFGVPGHWEVTTMSAIGGVAGSENTAPPGAPDVGPRRLRRELEDLLWIPAGPLPTVDAVDYEVTSGTDGVELIRRAVDRAVVGVVSRARATERPLWVADLGTQGSTIHESREAAIRAVEAHADANPGFHLE
jgi:hypothetical protein